MNAKLIRDNLANLLVKIKPMDVQHRWQIQDFSENERYWAVAPSGSTDAHGLILIQNEKYLATLFTLPTM